MNDQEKIEELTARIAEEIKDIPLRPDLQGVTNAFSKMTPVTKNIVRHIMATGEGSNCTRYRLGRRFIYMREELPPVIAAWFVRNGQKLDEGERDDVVGHNRPEFSKGAAA